MSKIELQDSMNDVFYKLSEGNPGAVACLVDLYKREGNIDPQSMMAPLGTMISMDDLGIYGSSIYVLWSDKCDRDTRLLVVLFRANQLGFVSREKIQELAADQTRSVTVDLAELDRKVCEQLDKFQRPELSEVESCQDQL